MEKQSTDKYARQVFTMLFKLIDPAFSFPGGGIAARSVAQCMAALERKHITLGRERIVDYCVCQAYAVTRFGEDYLPRWRVTHSFGEKALERYDRNTAIQKYHQDRWLREHGLSRGAILSLFQDRSQHPLFKFVFPEYEEGTKKRLLGTAAGFYICQVSTLGWTPFSPACECCPTAEKCREVTRQRYCELYRIRVEAYHERGRHGDRQ